MIQVVIKRSYKKKYDLLNKSTKVSIQRTQLEKLKCRLRKRFVRIIKEVDFAIISTHWHSTHEIFQEHVLITQYINHKFWKIKIFMTSKKQNLGKEHYEN